MSYAIGYIVYGFPVTEELNNAYEEMDEDWTELDAFEHRYSGSASIRPGWCGVLLCTIDECNDVLVSNLKLTPTAEQKTKAEAKFALLPKNIQAMCPPMDTYIIWGSS